MTLVAVVLCILLIVVAWSVLRFAHARRLAQRLLPRSGDVWTQDGQPLYVLRVTNQGLQLRLGGSGQGVEWSDSWQAWAMRVRNRVILRTEHRWKLEP
jgi:hypothetical protein